MGMNVEGKRAWKAEKRGAVVLGVTEKGKWLCVRVSVGTQPPDRFNVGAIDPVSKAKASLFPRSFGDAHMPRMKIPVASFI